MRSKLSLTLLSGLVIAAGGVVGGCTKPEPTETPAAAVATDQKIPVTTASEEARTAFLAGRSLSENLRVTDSITHFQQAVSLDPNFALAELSLANTAPTGRELFEHLDKAVGLADSVSAGERLLILATRAGVDGDAAAQKKHLEELVAAYPGDERAHFALGGYYFGQQDYPRAIHHYQQATQLAPGFAPVYNILGYAYRQAGDTANAEQAFQKYIELIPDDPNPYDSYAELLLKLGRFDDAIAQYRKALAVNDGFLNSHLGIAAALMYQGKSDEAAAELDAITEKARTDGERQTALFGKTVLAADGGRLDAALALVDEQYALAAAGNDVPTMSGSLQLAGNILLEMNQPAEAKQKFEGLLALLDGSDLSPAIKDNAHLFHHYNLARLALANQDAATAASEAKAFRAGAEASGNPGQVRQAHELLGMVALATSDFDAALAELAQANLQNPYNLYRQCQAQQGKGDQAKAREACAAAAEFNSIPLLNYAFVRGKARAVANG